jgi:hypothetical protein
MANITLKNITKDSEIKEYHGNIRTRFLDGAISGLVSGAALQPLQVIKTTMQVSPINKPSDHNM